MRSGTETQQNHKTHILSPPPNHFTMLTEEGALELRNLVSLPKPSHLVCIIADSEKNEVLQIKVQVTFIQNYSEKKIEGKSQNISGDENPTNSK